MAERYRIAATVLVLMLLGGMLGAALHAATRACGVILSSDRLGLIGGLISTAATLSVGFAAWVGLQSQIKLLRAQTQYDLMSRQILEMGPILAKRRKLTKHLPRLAVMLFDCTQQQELIPRLNGFFGIFENSADLSVNYLEKFKEIIGAPMEADPAMLDPFYIITMDFDFVLSYARPTAPSEQFVGNIGALLDRIKLESRETERLEREREALEKIKLSALAVMRVGDV